VPETYIDFMELFDEKALAQQSVILERIIKCNHPSLGANNTAKLGALYAFLLQWINDNTVEPPDNKFGSYLILLNKFITTTKRHFRFSKELC